MQTGFMNSLNPIPFLCILVVPVLFALEGEGADDDPTPRIIPEKEFSVIGIEVRTNNSREASAQGLIPKQWEKFNKDGVIGKIPAKVDSSIIVVYSAYQSDKTGDYNYLIGAKVSDASIIPDGMVAKTVPKGEYAFVTTSVGPVGKIVARAWQKIWLLEDQSHLGGVRSYKSDFELYDQRSRDPQNSQVDIYVGLK
jgi:predicted transcriptional regulator YdeE